jgi:DNA-binding NarL/FixJ family response regulator
MSARGPADKTTRHRVLIVDDEESTRLLMPGNGGYEVLKENRRASADVARPVIIASVLADKVTQDRCMKAGATAYMVKPVERNSLVATVKAQIAGRSKPKTQGK